MAQNHGLAVNANDVVGPILMSPDRIAQVAIQTDPTNAANAAFVLEGTYAGTPVAAGWLQLAATDPTSLTGALVNTFTGPNVAGVVQFNAGGISAIRARRTDANGGNAGVTVSVVQS